MPISIEMGIFLLTDQIGRLILGHWCTLKKESKVQQIDEMCPPVLENILSGGPGYVREDAFCINAGEHPDTEVIIRLVLQCHVNHLFDGAEGETWNICGTPNVEIKSGTILFRLIILPIRPREEVLEEKARVIWYQIPTGLYLNRDTLLNYLEKAFEDII